MLDYYFQFCDHSADQFLIRNLLVKTGIRSFEIQLNETENDLEITKIIDF